MQVHHDEGVATRIDPESCADAREGIGEASTGERIGQPERTSSRFEVWCSNQEVHDWLRINSAASEGFRMRRPFSTAPITL